MSSKSTPSYVGGTVGFLARKAADSGVGIVISLQKESSWTGEWRTQVLSCGRAEAIWRA